LFCLRKKEKLKKKIKTQNQKKIKKQKTKQKNKTLLNRQSLCRNPRDKIHLGSVSGGVFLLSGLFRPLLDSKKGKSQPRFPQ
jgi:hypothetical protein